MSVTFEYRFPMQKPPKVSLRLLEMPVKYFCISPGGGGGGGEGEGEGALVLRLHFTFVEETVQRTLFSMFTK